MERAHRGIIKKDRDEIESRDRVVLLNTDPCGQTRPSSERKNLRWKIVRAC
jgi:hypothetical protein